MTEVEALKEKPTKDLLVELVVLQREANQIAKTHHRWVLIAIIILAVGAKGMEWFDKVLGKASAEMLEFEK